MPEGLKLVVGADVTQAEKALKDFANEAEEAAGAISHGLGGAFSELKKQGVVSLGSIENALKQFKEALSVATDPGDIEKLNKGISFLSREADKFKKQGLGHHLDGVSRSTQKASATSLKLANVIGLFPPHVQHLAHSFEGLIHSYEQIRSKTNTSGEALKKLSSAFAGPLGIGVAISVGASLLSSFGVKLFHAGEEAKKTADRIKELIKPISELSSTSAAGTSGELAQVSALVSVVTNLNKSYGERKRALEELKDINKNYFGDLTLEASSLLLLKQRVDEYTKALIQQAVIKQFSEEISKVSVAIAKQVPLIGQASAELKKLEREQKRVESSAPKFSGLAAQANTDELNKAVGAVDKANSKLREEGNILNQLAGQSRDLRKALSDAVLESLKFKPLDDPSGGGKSSVDKTIETAKRLASFLDKNTQFSVTFEVDPLDSENESIKKAQEFIDRAKNFIEKGTPEFRFKPLVRTEFNFIRDGKFLQNIRDQAEILGTRTFKEVKKDFEDAILKAGKENPIVANVVAQVNADIRKEDLQNQQLLSGLGLKIDTSVLTNVQKESIAAANTLNDILTPAFQDMFTAIKAGENPLKSFFLGIGRAVEQLIQKLIAAAVQALILSALFPGGAGGAAGVKGFGGFFKNILGFAKGGIVSGPTLSLIGEGINTSRSNPEVVAPLDQLRSMIGDLGVGTMQPVVLRTSIRGNNLSLIQARTDRRNRRLGA